MCQPVHSIACKSLTTDRFSNISQVQNWLEVDGLRHLHGCVIENHSFVMWVYCTTPNPLTPKHCIATVMAGGPGLGCLSPAAASRFGFVFLQFGAISTFQTHIVWF